MAGLCHGPEKKGQDALRVFLRLRFAAPPEHPECVSQAEPLLQTDCCTTTFALGLGTLLALDHEIVGEKLGRRKHGRPRILSRHQDDAVAEMLDKNRVTLEAELLGQPDRLALAVPEKLGCFHLFSSLYP